LLSAGVRVPSELLVHGYVTVGGEKIGKSRGNAIEPRAACAVYGTDALRYYLLRHVGSQRDGDFSWTRFHGAYAHELANDLGNLVSRTTALSRRYGVPAPSPSTLTRGLHERVDACIEDFALDRALDAIWTAVGDANAYVNRVEPWKLAKRGAAAALAESLGELHGALRCIGEALEPFLPHTAERLLQALDASAPTQLFPRSRVA
jgi:methionyl-tRNA synthetase